MFHAVTVEQWLNNFNFHSSKKARIIFMLPVVVLKDGEGDSEEEVVDRDSSLGVAKRLNRKRSRIADPEDDEPQALNTSEMFLSLTPEAQPLSPPADPAPKIGTEAAPIIVTEVQAEQVPYASPVPQPLADDAVSNATTNAFDPAERDALVATLNEHQKEDDSSRFVICSKVTRHRHAN